MLIILASVIFYLLGRYCGHEAEVVKQATAAIQKRFRTVQPGPVKFLSSKEREYTGSEAEKRDQDILAKARSAGILP